jgi:hypothetical protein
MRNAGMIYGYARVSTDAQDLTSQLAQLKATGCETVAGDINRHRALMARSHLMAQVYGAHRRDRAYSPPRLTAIRFLGRGHPSGWHRR